MLRLILLALLIPPAFAARLEIPLRGEGRRDQQGKQDEAQHAPLELRRTG